MPDLSIVIVSYNTRDVLRRCLIDLFTACTHVKCQVIVVDNGSTDGTLSILRDEFNQVELVANTSNTGFAAANNQGMALATSDYLLLVNSDAFMTTEAIAAGIRLLDNNPEVGMAGVQLANEDGTFQAGSAPFPSLWDDMLTSTGLNQFVRRRTSDQTAAGPVDWVQGACMFVRRSALEDVGGLDERFFMYSEEVDWCWRFWREGWEVWQIPEISIIHLGGASSLSNDTGRRTALYRSRLGLRRRLGGPAAACVLWLVMIAGLSARVTLRSMSTTLLRRNVGRNSPRADAQLLLAMLRSDPLARQLAE